MTKKVLYLTGSLRNPRVPELGAAIRRLGFEVFDDWYAAGEKADDAWQSYEKARGHTYAQALAGYSAKHVFLYDLAHLHRSALGVLWLPAGKSGHMELGFLKGQGKKIFIGFEEEPDRWDAMYGFADKVCIGEGELLTALRGEL